jgi:alpha-glucosidase
VRTNREDTMRTRSRLVAPVVLTLLASGLTSGPATASDVPVVSPDGSVQIKLSVRDARLHYEVTFRDKPVIEASPLVVTLDGVDVTDRVGLGDVKRYKLDETYPWRGVHAVAANRCNGATVRLNHPAVKDDFTLDVRAFNDGIAFRYAIAGGEGGPRVPDEATRFLVPAGSAVWYHGLEGHYEGMYQKKAVAEVPAGEWAAPPFTFQLPGGAGYAAITEAALVNYSGMALQADGRRGFNLALGHKHHVSYPFRLRYANDVERVTKPAAIAGTITSPWRVVMVGADLNALVNCDIVADLCRGDLGQRRQPAAEESPFRRAEQLHGRRQRRPAQRPLPVPGADGQDQARQPVRRQPVRRAVQPERRLQV